MVERGNRLYVFFPTIPRDFKNISALVIVINDQNDGLFRLRFERFHYFRVFSNEWLKLRRALADLIKFPFIRMLIETHQNFAGASRVEKLREMNAYGFYRRTDVQPIRYT